MKTPSTEPRGSSAQRVHVVCLPGGIEAFNDLEAARDYTVQHPGASCHSVPLRHGRDAVVVANHRLVIKEGCLRSAWQADVIEFYDDGFTPPEADVETYEKEPGEWHVVGFGTNRQLLAEQLEQAVAASASFTLGDRCRPVAEP